MQRYRKVGLLDYLFIVAFGLGILIAGLHGAAVRYEHQQEVESE